MYHWTLQSLGQQALSPIVHESYVLASTTLLLLSHCSCVQLRATLCTAAHQASLSTGFSRQESWRGVPSPPALLSVTNLPDEKRFPVCICILLTTNASLGISVCRLWKVCSLSFIPSSLGLFASCLLISRSSSCIIHVILIINVKTNFRK